MLHNQSDNFMNEFKGKVAIVTGAGQGIGFEICHQLAKRGANLLLNDLEEKLVNKACRKLLDCSSSNIKCIGIHGDAGDLELIDRMILLAMENFGRLDYVIANAGITTFGTFLDYTIKDFHKLIHLNLQGSFFLCQKAAREMIEKGIPGRILLMSSATAHQAHHGLTAYGMTKAALKAFAKFSSIELAQHGITVNAISPGATLTERTLKDPEYEVNWKLMTPTGIVTEVGDIAHTALFLLTENSRQITGQTIIVDGGWTATSPGRSSSLRK